MNPSMNPMNPTDEASGHLNANSRRKRVRWSEDVSCLSSQNNKKTQGVTRERSKGGRKTMIVDYNSPSPIAESSRRVEPKNVEPKDVEPTGEEDEEEPLQRKRRRTTRVNPNSNTQRKNHDKSWPKSPARRGVLSADRQHTTVSSQLPRSVTSVDEDIAKARKDSANKVLEDLINTDSNNLSSTVAAYKGRLKDWKVWCCAFLYIIYIYIKETAHNKPFL